ncbi:MAG: trypsin-like peptidase domain-containing protein [Bacteroidales bacterium]
MKAKQLIVSIMAGIFGGIMSFFAVNHLVDKISDESRPHDLVEAYESSLSNSLIKPTGFPQMPSGNTDLTKAAKVSLSAVVHITSYYNQQEYSLYDFIFGTDPGRYRHTESSGSGVIISSDGYIVTNRHVIDQSEKIKVVLNNRKSYEAEIIGTDATTDIALLKVDADNLNTLSYGDSDALNIGEWVLAVGNPFNLTSTVTAGIVSAKARNISIFTEQYSIESFIQTDAAVNPGNSGGALVNQKGELVGINTAIASKTGSYIGYSFAIPVNIVRKIVADLIEYGNVQRAYMGVSLSNIDAGIADKFDLKTSNGILITGVSDGSAADEAEIKAGDIIKKFNGVKVNSVSQLMEQISKYRPGDNVNISIIRNNKEMNKKLTLRNKHGNTDLVSSTKIDELGGEFEKASLEEKRKLRLRYGVKICELYSGKLRESGINKGFIITSINNIPVKKVEDINEIIDKYKGSKILIEGVYPNGNIAYYSIYL